MGSEEMRLVFQGSPWLLPCCPIQSSSPLSCRAHDCTLTSSLVSLIIWKHSVSCFSGMSLNMDAASHLHAVTIMMFFKMQFLIAKNCLSIGSFVLCTSAQNIIWFSTCYDCELQFRCLQHIIYNITEHSVQSWGEKNPQKSTS